MNQCDLVHNMCGWFIQFNENGTVIRSELNVKTEMQACSVAHDLGFDMCVIWDYEQHVKDVVIPKQSLGKQERFHVAV